MTTKSETMADSVSAFAALWFKYLDQHAPAGQVVDCLATDGLEMVFPERTLRSIDDFRDWYATVCRAYTDETHVVEEVTPSMAGDDINVDVVVVWRATQTSDGSRLAMRARQRWVLRRTDTEMGLAIAEYRVDELTSL
ncbi:hypothetical protein FHR83_003643 [Actinoplanes campanulatus]|uniref:SnoaL-like domain-containing protein n=1 Tax=Actinoplanes campanulatus TaxID=113559 RepID=A0A7W5AGV7_9ACTN|nr:hypothetical protein [Actinoplanes campanulatus]MBB3095973.1 hypothetical protein [Actinoplanes campanulatus]GGN12818.1 hypothetical protein GCM10010109_23560 [Actinoplanes campanulatus]GID36932.1 hypothetical protein Aca09nite_34380 [Actinoplanes campanulatus]